MTSNFRRFTLIGQGLILLFSLTAVSSNQPKDVEVFVEGRVEMNAEERAFTENLNRLREQYGESPIEYFAYQTSDGHRYVMTSQIVAEKQSRITFKSYDYLYRLYERSKGRPVVLELFTGFSGAGYDMGLLRADLIKYTQLAIAENKRAFGHDTLTIFISGATQDGIGLIYSPEITGADLIKTGIVSDQAMDSHFKYGNVLALQQDAILIVDSFKLPGGAKSWEVKSHSEASSLNDKIHDGMTTNKTKHLVFEGGDVSFKEALEWLTSRMDASYVDRKFELNLIIGYQPSLPKKDKGYRAASQLTELLLRFPQLVPKNVEVRIREAVRMESISSLDEFRNTKAARRLLDRRSKGFVEYAERRKARIAADKQAWPDWYRMRQAELEAEVRQLDAWTNIYTIAKETLAEAKNRKLASLKHWIKSHEEHGQYSNVAELAIVALNKEIKNLDAVLASIQGQVDESVCGPLLR